MANVESYLELSALLATMRGTVAVVLGGSRAVGTATKDSDIDLGVYYRGQMDLSALAALGTVYPPGSWGRLMNGGAWLQIGGTKVDVLLRDLDVVEHWTARAQEGQFEIDNLLGYVAGAPTYLLLAERAVSVTLHGILPSAPSYPELLAQRGPRRWRYNAKFSLDYARMHALRGDTIGSVAHASKAVLEEAHARLSAQRSWVLNEKSLVERAGLQELQARFGSVPDSTTSLHGWLDSLEAELFATGPG